MNRCKKGKHKTGAARTISWELLGTEYSEISKDRSNKMIPQSPLKHKTSWVLFPS